MAHGAMHTTSMVELHKTQFGGPYHNPLITTAPNVHMTRSFGTSVKEFGKKEKRKRKGKIWWHLEQLFYMQVVITQTTSVQHHSNPYMAEASLGLHKCNT